MTKKKVSSVNINGPPRNYGKVPKKHVKGHVLARSTKWRVYNVSKTQV